MELPQESCPREWKTTLAKGLKKATNVILAGEQDTAFFLLLEWLCGEVDKDTRVRKCPLQIYSQTLVDTTQKDNRKCSMW